MELRNVSGMDLDVPDLRRIVAAGEVVEVTNEQVAAGMVGQVGVWEQVGATSTTEQAAPAAVEG